MKDYYYVYILTSQSEEQHHYIGITQDLSKRLKMHNQGHVIHTSKFRPWKIDTAIAFASKLKAMAFEKYLKSHSGRAFAKRHF